MELTRGITVRQTLSCVRLAIIVVASAITPKTRGAALFRNIRTRRTPLCTLIFEIAVLETSCACQKRQWKWASGVSGKVKMGPQMNQPTHRALASRQPRRGTVATIMLIGLLALSQWGWRVKSRAQWVEAVDRLSRHANAFALAQSHLCFSQFCNDLFWLGSFSHRPAPSLRSQS